MGFQQQEMEGTPKWNSEKKINKGNISKVEPAIDDEALWSW